MANKTLFTANPSYNRHL